MREMIMHRLKAGTIAQYNEKFDYVNPRQPIPLKMDENVGLYNWVTTIENSFVDIITANKDLNVFASDAVITTLMTAPLSVYPWDISVEKRDGKTILEYNENKLFDYTTVYESALIPPEEDPKKRDFINGPKKLSWEATMSNHYFSQQALQPKTEQVLGADPGFKLPEKKEKPKKGYIYKVWQMEKGIKLCVRCQVDGYIKVQKSEEKMKVEAEEKEKEKEKKEKKEKKERKESADAAKPVEGALGEEKKETGVKEEVKKEAEVKEEEKKDSSIELINIKAVNEYYEAKRVNLHTIIK